MTTSEAEGQWRGNGQEGARLRVERPGEPLAAGALAADVREGLGRRPYRLPPRYFYDRAGAELFDRICDTPEYYLTRAEARLLARVAPEVVALSGARELVELGSGAARKTRLLIEAFLAARGSLTYRPVDVSEGMLVESARALLADYAGLHVHAVVGDYDRDVPRPGGEARLVAFLGSTVGNLAPGEAEGFLARLATKFGPRDRLLLGFDLVKDRATLERAYNDAAGVTAAFNRNVLRVINRELGGEFDPERFEHVAFFNEREAQIEMHLRAREAHEVPVAALGMRVPFDAGETIHTEISRKFTHESAAAMLAEGGFEVVRAWDEAGAFGLALARPRG